MPVLDIYSLIDWHSTCFR